MELWQPPRPTDAQRTNVELAVSFAASIVSDLSRRGGRMLWVAVAAAETSFVSGPTSLPLTREVMESLAVAEATTSDPLPDALSRILDQVRPGTNVIVITTRPANFSDTDRFQKLWHNPRQRTWLSRLQSIDVSGPQLSEYFVPR